MPTQFDHERLKVYQEALRFIAWASPIIEELPAKLSARDQLDRASTSIALNLAEGTANDPILTDAVTLTLPAVQGWSALLALMSWWLEKNSPERRPMRAKPCSWRSFQ
jgi:hypothetical protein